MQLISKIFLYFNTIRYLRYTQIIYRIFYFIRPVIKAKQICASICPPQGKWTMIKNFKSDELDGDNKINLLGEIGVANEWKPRKALLWKYHLHYFDYCSDINFKNTDLIYENINHWIKNNKFSEGIGWDSYPTSLRIVNWIKFGLNGNNLSQEIITSLSSQAYYLSKNLEYHLYANHLLRNGKALCFAGLFLDSKLSEKWLKIGVKIISREVNEQILEDGGHIELSPMYHSNTLEDLLDLINISRAYPRSELSKIRKKLEQAVTKMNNWLSEMSHPDEDISFFNDSALETSLKPKFLERYSKKLFFSQTKKNKNISHLKDSGYVVINNEKFKLICDVGEIGCKYTPGHGHADILSFELSVLKKRLIVNSGTSIYGNSKLRIDQRKTKSHNTIEINNRDSSEIWSGFRVGRRASPYEVSIKENEVKGSYKSYQKIINPYKHERTWIFYKDEIEIIDKLQGSFFSARSFFYFHPDIRISLKKDYLLVCDTELNTNYKVIIEGGEVKLENSYWYPEFGKSIPNQRVLVNVREKISRFKIQF